MNSQVSSSIAHPSLWTLLGELWLERRLACQVSLTQLRAIIAVATLYPAICCAKHWTHTIFLAGPSGFGIVLPPHPPLFLIHERHRKADT